MKKSLLATAVFLSLCISLFIGNSAFAMQYDTLYASDRSYLSTIDSATGIGTSVAPISGFTQLIDLAFLGTQLYASGYTGAIDVTSFSLFRMNPDTASTTLIGLPGSIFAGMAGGTDGYLYGAYKDFYKVNPLTGVATLIGSLGNNLVIEGDIAFSPTGILYASFSNGQLGIIDTLTGKATLVGNIGFSGVINLSFKDGVLYGGDRSGRLLKIDTNTGQGTLVGTDTRAYLGGMTTSPGPFVNPTSPYIITLKLGKTLSFDYFWQMGIDPPPYQPGYMFDVLAPQGGIGWQFIGQIDAYGSSTGWSTAMLNVPKDLQGTETQIRFVLTDYSPETDPTVYLRNITAVPEPSIMILLGISMMSVVGLRRWWKE